MPNPTLVRPAAAPDAPAIAALYRELVSNPAVNVAPEQVDALSRDPRAALLVAEVDGEVVGSVLLALCPDAMFGRQPFAVVENIVVSARCRGRGVGSALLRALERLALDSACSKIQLLSAAHRADAHRLFERAGFEGTLKKGFVKYRRRFEGASA